MSHVFLRQKLTAVAQVEFLHPLSERMGASIPQMIVFGLKFTAIYGKFNSQRDKMKCEKEKDHCM